MVVFGQKWLYSGKVVLFGKKVVVFGQSECIRAIVVVFEEVVLFGQKCNRVKLSLSVKNG